MLEYVDFEVKIERRRGREYDVSVSSPPAGEASGTFVLPFTPKRLEGIRETIKIALVHSMMPVRRMVPPEFEKVEEFGRELHSALFRDDVKACYDRIFGVALREGKGLRLKLRLDPTLTSLPWEFMYSREMRDYLALCRGIPLVRYTELRQPVVPLQVTPPLRVLVVIASPSDYDPLNVEREKERIYFALKEPQERGIIKVEFFEGKNTLPSLLQRLRGTHYHVLHFIGHGDYDEEAEEGLLLMEDARGRGTPVSGHWLGRLLRDYFPMRLVVLNACEGALTSSSDPFAGVAAAVVGAGVPAVVAMQFEISDKAAIIFSREFYNALADNYPVDSAVTEARMAIVFSRRNTIEWATPVLYMRAPDGMLFALQEIAERKPDEERLAALYAQADALFEANNWSEAIACCEEILATDPTHRDALNLLAKAKEGLAHQEKEEKLARLYNEAMESSRRGAWQQAIVKLQQVLDLEKGYKDAAAKLAVAQEELAKAEAERKKREKLADLYEQALAAMNAEQWQKVIQRCDDIATLDANYRDVAQLRAQAEATLRDDREAEEQIWQGEHKGRRVPSWLWGILALVVLVVVGLAGLGLDALLSSNATPTPLIVIATSTSTKDPYEDGQRELSALQQIGGVAGTEPGQFQSPRALAVGSDGTIYVADTGNHRVQVLRTDGTFVREWGTEGAGQAQFEEPWGIAVGKEGNIYVSDTWNHRVQKFDNQGNFITTWGHYGATSGTLGESSVFWGPRGLAVGQDGDLYVVDAANNRVQVFAPDGTFVAQYGGVGVVEGRFNEPIDLAQDAAGNWYVTDTWNRRVQKFDSDFTYLTQWLIAGWAGKSVLNKPFVAVDSSRGIVYTTDPENHRVVAFNTDGSFQATFGQYGADAQSFLLPNGIAVGPDGRIYVADAGGHRIMIFPPLQ